MKSRRHNPSRHALWLVLGLLPGLCRPASAQERVIEILADHDSRYKIAGENSPEITLIAGEPVLLRITARKAKSRNRDGSIHGFVMLRANHSRVPGWELLLRPGTQDFELTAPLEPGEYQVVCTVICSEDHEGMNMKVKIVAAAEGGAQ
jgi:heme/copper-type cytochrome/quinol oxidase subunit 2